MIKKIWINNDLTVKQKVKNSLFYMSRVRGAKKSWNKRHSKLLSKNEIYGNPCDSDVESKHQKLWLGFRTKSDLTTLRIAKNISGVSDPRIIPEDIYTADIEPSLIIDQSVDYIGIKSFYNRWFPNGIFPKDLFHRIDGKYLDKDLNSITYDIFKDMSKKITYPVVLKPNKDSYGGMDINIVESSKELIELAVARDNFVAQEKIEQHDFFNRFYPDSLNTIKVFLYRSVINDKLHILSMALRMGKDGSLDNEAAGGINSFVRSDGILNGYAIDKLGTKYDQHPNTQMKFNCKIPDLEKLKKLSLSIGEKVFYTRIFALDACYDKSGNWRILEINTYGQSIRFSQYGGQPFFGEFTDEVIEFCQNNHWALK